MATSIEPLKLYNQKTTWAEIKYQIPTPEKFHYYFLHWSLIEDGPKISDSYVFTSDTVLHAVYEKIPIVISIDFNTNGGTNINSFKTQSDVTFGYIKNFLVTPYKEKYSFSFWSLTENGEPISDDYIFTTSTTLFANYVINEEENIITILLDTQGAGELTTINTNKSLWKDIKPLVETPTLSGKNFMFWSLTKGGEEISENYVFTKNTTIYAVWEELSE